MFKRKLSLFLVIAAIFLNINMVLAESVNFGGSFEASGTSQTFNDDSIFPLPGTPVYFGDTINFRGDFGFYPSEQVGLKLRLSYQNTSIQDQPDNGNFILSRGYIDLNPNNLVSLRIGKQRLAWGSGYAWNPTNILDQKRNAFTPSDNPEGVIAFRSDLNLGLVTGQFFLIPGDTWLTSGRAVKLKASPAGVDLTLGWVLPGNETTALTTDLAYSIAGIGLHGEILYQAEGNRRSDKTDVLNYLVGADCNLPGGFYLALEYYHNDEAFKDINDLIVYLITHFVDSTATQNFVVDQSNNGGITRDHVFLRCAKTFGEDLNTEMLLVYNPSDQSLVAQPKLSYTLGQNTEIFVKGLLISGDGNVEANLSPFKSQMNFGVKVSF